MTAKETTRTHIEIEYACGEEAAMETLLKQSGAEIHSHQQPNTPDGKGRVVAIVWCLLCLCVLSGCAADSSMYPNPYKKPAGYTDRAWHAKLKADGVGFWDRNTDKPFSEIPLLIEGLSQLP